MFTKILKVLVVIASNIEFVLKLIKEIREAVSEPDDKAAQVAEMEKEILEGREA